MKICLNCNSITTYVYKGKENWYKYKNGYLCKKCRLKIVDNPKNDPIWNPIKNKKWNPINQTRRIQFTPLHKQIVLEKNPRKGICSFCGKTNCKTDMHHIEYHIEDPLKDTIELCASCHRKQHKSSLE